MCRPYLHHYASALARSQELSQAIARKELDKRLANITGDKAIPGRQTAIETNGKSSPVAPVAVARRLRRATLNNRWRLTCEREPRACRGVFQVYRVVA